jgi:hypothetical protein
MGGFPFVDHCLQWSTLAIGDREQGESVAGRESNKAKLAQGFSVLANPASILFGGQINKRAVVVGISYILQPRYAVCP